MITMADQCCVDLDATFAETHPTVLMCSHGITFAPLQMIHEYEEGVCGMAKKLHGKRIAVLVANGFEQVDLIEPRKALESAGAKIDVVSPEKARCAGGTIPTGVKPFPSIGRSSRRGPKSTTRSCCKRPIAVEHQTGAGGRARPLTG
jgi:hypothetical protein